MTRSWRPGAEERLAASNPPLPERGDGAAAALAELIELARARNPLERAALLPFRHRRHHPGRPRRRLAHLGARPGRPSRGPPRRSDRGSRRSRRAGCASCSSCRTSSPAPWSPGRRWPTSPACSPPAAGGRRARAEPTPTGWAAASRRPRSSPAATCIPAPCRRSACSAWAATNVRRLARDGVGRLDLDALAARAEGGVRAGDRDRQRRRGQRRRLRPDRRDGRARPEPRRLASRRRRLRPLRAPRARARDALTEGVELADSVTVDAHKWLNVPYDCGFAFVREPRDSAALSFGAPYLPSPDDPEPNLGLPDAGELAAGPRALAVWATLRAYGRAGHREMVERHLRLARRLGERVDAEPELERLADVNLNIVCFRARPEGVAGGRPRRAQRRARRGAAGRRPRIRGQHDLRREGRACDRRS